MADELVNTERIPQCGQGHAGTYRGGRQRGQCREDRKENSITASVWSLWKANLVPGGAISGGAFKNYSNLLGRRRDGRTGEKGEKKLSDDIKTYNQKIEGAKSKRNKLRMDLEALKTEMQRKSIEQNTARLNISRARERMEEEAESAQSLKLEEQEIETRSSRSVPARKQSRRNWLPVKNWRRPLRNRFLSSRRNWRAADWKRVKLPPMPENGK